MQKRWTAAPDRQGWLDDVTQCGDYYALPFDRPDVLVFWRYECGKQDLATPLHGRWTFTRTGSATDKPGPRMKFKVIVAQVEKQRPSDSSSTVCRPESSHLYSIVNYQAFQGS